MSQDTTIRFACPWCNKQLRAPATKGGEEVLCRGCTNRILIPPPAALPLESPAPHEAPRPTPRAGSGQNAPVPLIPPPACDDPDTIGPPPHTWMRPLGAPIRSEAAPATALGRSANWGDDMKTAPSLLPEPRGYAGTAIMLGAITALP